MPQSALEMAKDLTLTLVEAGRLSAEDMQDTLQRTHATLTALKAQEEFGATAVPVVKTVADWRKSITKHAVTCLECGKTFKQLSTHHLMRHGLDGRTYRTKYGIPRTQSLAAKETTARRRKVTQEVRPWEKTPWYRRAQESDGKAPAVAAPTTAKRGRKTARKKRSEG